jgi:hypothetical protein
MDLQSIRRLNLTANALLVSSALMVFAGIPIGALVSMTLGIATMVTGFIGVAACLLLSFAVDRVKCPNCGKPFNRPDYKNWLLRTFAKTQTARQCVHCGYD